MREEHWKKDIVQKLASIVIITVKKNILYNSYLAYTLQNRRNAHHFPYFYTYENKDKVF